MKKLALTVVTVLATGLIHAADTFPHHMFTLTENGFGAYASYEKFEPRSDSIFEEYNVLHGNISLNYAYGLTSRFQLGGFVSNLNEKRDFTTQDGDKTESSTNYLEVGLMAFYNFQDDLYHSHYLGVMASHLNNEEQYDGKVQDFLEDDRSAQIYQLVYGKRFHLKKWNLPIISYSPSLSIFMADSRKDYEDDKINHSYGVRLDLIKFDVMF